MNIQPNNRRTSRVSVVDFRCGLVACVLGASCWLWWLVVVAVASWCWCWFCYWEVSTVTQAVLFLLGSLNGDPGRTLFYWEVSTVTQAVHFTVLESLNGDPGRTLFTGKSNGDPGRTHINLLGSLTVTQAVLYKSLQNSPLGCLNGLPRPYTV